MWPRGGGGAAGQFRRGQIDEEKHPKSDYVPKMGRDEGEQRRKGQTQTARGPRPHTKKFPSFPQRGATFGTFVTEGTFGIFDDANEENEGGGRKSAKWARIKKIKK